VLAIDWKLFSLEVNASPPDADFWDKTRRFGEAHVALILARRERGNQAFEDLYVALGRRLHDEKEAMSLDILTQAASEAGLADLLARTIADPRLSHEVIEEYQAARARDVFGVPTLSIDGSKVLYGPILPLAPVYEEAIEWWTHIRWLLQRPDFFELKRWPRDIKPGVIASP
jgi:predicted DsbA family dithiol-disulfide isomerase